MRSNGEVVGLNVFSRYRYGFYRHGAVSLRYVCWVLCSELYIDVLLRLVEGGFGGGMGRGYVHGASIA